jgi:hypothetical protein
MELILKIPAARAFWHWIPILEGVSTVVVFFMAPCKPTASRLPASINEYI